MSQLAVTLEYTNCPGIQNLQYVADYRNCPALKKLPWNTDFGPDSSLPQTADYSAHSAGSVISTADCLQSAGQSVQSADCAENSNQVLKNTVFFFLISEIGLSMAGITVRGR